MRTFDSRGFGWRWPTSRQWLIGVLFLVLVNAPFWPLQNQLFLLRGAFDLTLLLPLLLLRWRAAALLLVVALWCFDLLVSQALAYHFISPRDFVAAARFLPEIEVSRFATVENLLFVLPFVAALAGLGWLAGRTRGSSAPALCLLSAALVLVDTVNGSSVFSRHQTRWLPFNVASSPFGVLAVGQRTGAPAPIVPALDGESASTVAKLVQWAEQHPEGSILVVLVESLGWPREPELQQWLRSKLIDDVVAARYVVVERVLPFRGATTYAELRTLCGVEGGYSQLQRAIAANCLPALLGSKGWTSIGLHGFSGTMFDRTSWWPRLGLQQQSFGGELLAQGGTWCGGAFRGVCDNDLIRIAARELNAPRRLVYALTLSSHLPIDAKPLPADLAALCGRLGIVADVCQLHAALGQALDALRAVVASETRRPLAALIAGDHAPPFMKLDALDSVMPGVVPSWTLVARDAAPPPRR